MYATIDIGNPCMTHELVKGNLRMLMYAGCNVDSRVQYASCNGDSHVRNSTLKKNYIASWFKGKCIPSHSHL